MSEELMLGKKTRSSLGRGLGSLLGENNMTSSEKPGAQAAVPATTDLLKNESRVWLLPVEKVFPNKEQPRKNFSQDQLKELAASIKEKGVIQPILVRQKDANSYEIIAGERRWRASQIAGMKTVPAIIKGVGGQETLELALIENIQRSDLNPVEEAEAYALLAKRYNLTQADLAQKTGKDRATVANIMRLLSLHVEVREMVKSGALQMGQAKLLMSVEDLSQQANLARVAAQRHLTVRQLDQLIKRAKQSGAQEYTVESEKDLIVQKMLKEVALELQKKFGTKVTLDQAAGRGQLSIYFYNNEEMNSLIDRLRRL